MREKEMLAVVKALAQQPTAPFHETAVRAEIEGAAARKCRTSLFGGIGSAT